MRIVIGLLIAVNFLLFYWVMAESNQEDRLVLEVSKNMPPLQLLSDAILQTETSSVKSVIQPDINKTQLQTNTQNRAKSSARAVFLELSCYSLGPFEGKTSVKSASLTLTELGLVTAYKSETRREVSGFWVYIPPLPTRSDARKVISILKKRGIKDFLIVSSGDKRNAISLGFFGTREGAQQHQTRMKALGLSPILEDSYKDISGYWLDFSSPNNPPLPKSVLEALHHEYDDISVKKRICLK